MKTNQKIEPENYSDREVLGLIFRSEIHLVEETLENIFENLNFKTVYFEILTILVTYISKSNIQFNSFECICIMSLRMLAT